MEHSPWRRPPRSWGRGGTVALAALERGLAKKGDLIVLTFSKGTATTHKILAESESMLVGVIKV
jgi:hypothetical protein